MRKGKSVIGKLVLSLDEGLKLEKVTDVVVDAEGKRVVALVVNEGGFMSSSKVVPTAEVQSFGKDAVVVRSAGSVVSVADHADLRALVDRDEKVVGKKVFTITGEDEGSIGDIYFDEDTGDVVGYEVSSGALGDAAKGTSYLATDDIARVGTDIVYVRPETAQVLEDQVGGVQGAMQDAGQKLDQAKEAVGEKLGQTTGEVGRKSKQLTGVGPGAPKPEEPLIGKRTGSDVEADDGSVIVPKGRRIRAQDVAAARDAGKLPALTTAAAMGAAQDAGAGAKDALGSVGDSATSLWDQFMAKIGEMTDATGQRVDEEQTKQRLTAITDAVGRPVTKVILDRDDNVVLNLGDIITHQAIQRAHEAGGLDSLLACVYKGEVEFSKEEMRAPEEATAEATVEKATGGAVFVDELEGKVDAAEKKRQAELQRKNMDADAQRAQREAERQKRATEREAAKQRRDDEPQDEQVLVTSTAGPPATRATVRPSKTR
jgi:uncharacterized protein YrrD